MVLSKFNASITRLVECVSPDELHYTCISRCYEAKQKKFLLEKMRVAKKCPQGRQGIHFFPNCQTIHAN